MLDRGDVVWLVGLAPLLTLDAALVVSGHRSLSRHARDHRVTTSALLVYLAAHLLYGDSFRHDPLGMVARWLSPEKP